MSNITKVGAQMSKTKKRAERRNNQNTSLALDDDEAIFGRVTKALGNRQFLVTIWDSGKNKHIVDVRCTIPKKKVRIDINDIVNVAGDGEFWEIQAQLDSKLVSKLKKEGRISADLARTSDSNTEVSQDVGIEFDYEDEAGENNEIKPQVKDKKDKASMKGASRSSKLEAVLDEDLDDEDIDNI